MNPKSRNEGLLVQEIGEELVIHDRHRPKAHRLNATAALVWRHCDGQHSVADLAKLLQRRLDAPQSEELVRLTLTMLEKERLLQKAPARPGWTTAISRRRLILTLGKSGMLAFLLPVVSSVALPKYTHGFAS
jgi:hypothetical protein